MHFITIFILLIGASSSDTTTSTEHPLSKENRALQLENEKLMNMLHDAIQGKGHKRQNLVKKKDFLMQENARLMNELEEELDGTELDVVESEDKSLIKQAQNQKSISKENDMLSKENERLMKLIEESLSHAKKGFSQDEESRFLIEENQKLMGQIREAMQDSSEERRGLEQPPPKKQNGALSFFTKLFAFIGAGYLIYNLYAMVTAHTHIDKFSKEMEETNFERERLEV